MGAIEWAMMAAFVAALGLSLWKLYAFLPNKPLPDDDMTEEALEKLTALMVKCLVEHYESGERVDLHTLYKSMIRHETFDGEHFWRFNPNKLNNLIIRYFARHPHASTLEHIYELETKRPTPRV